jgi:hypothetical protein
MSISRGDWIVEDMVAAVEVTPPGRIWTEIEFSSMRQGCLPKDQGDKWFIFFDGDVLHAHRSWSGFEIYRADFVAAAGGWRVLRLLVESDEERCSINPADEAAPMFEELVDLLVAGQLTTEGPIFDLVLPTWRPRPDSEARKASAVALARAVLAVRDEALMFHLREFLTNAIWKYTESDGKYTTRYRSVGSLGKPPSLLHHEHVIPRKLLIDQILANPENVADVIATAIGCVVLREEHVRLNAVGKADASLEGWERYRRAGVTVVDLSTGTYVIG